MIDVKFMCRPFSDDPETLMVAPVALVRFNVPAVVLLNVGVKAVLSLVDVSGVADVRFSTPLVPKPTVGAALPPELLKVMLFNVLVPTRFNTPLPLIVTLLVAAI